MSSFLPTIILRHRKENLKKCSLRGLEMRSDFRFIRYPFSHLPDLSSYILLSLDGATLTSDDTAFGILLIDGTWKHTDTMLKKLPPMQTRTLPRFIKTAYPRRQNDCIDPTRGLASIEAIYMAYKILGRNLSGLLEHYYWKDFFLEKNANLTAIERELH